MTCADLEILLCDYVDGTLHGTQKSAVEEHLKECATCAELARDCAGAVAFMERAAEVEPPAELVTRILFEVSSGRGGVSLRPTWIRRFFGKWLEPILQPRWAMGMAMTVLSFAMMGRFAGVEVRQLKPSDLDPVKIWVALDDRAHRTWERGVKYYQSIRLVFEIQTRLKEWGDQADAERGGQVQTPAPGGTNPGAPSDRQPGGGGRK